MHCLRYLEGGRFRFPGLGPRETLRSSITKDCWNYKTIEDFGKKYFRSCFSSHCVLRAEGMNIWNLHRTEHISGSYASISIRRIIIFTLIHNLFLRMMTLYLSFSFAFLILFFWSSSTYFTLLLFFSYLDPWYTWSLTNPFIGCESIVLGQHHQQQVILRNVLCATFLWSPAYQTTFFFLCRSSPVHVIWWTAEAFAPYRHACRSKTSTALLEGPRPGQAGSMTAN